MSVTVSNSSANPLRSVLRGKPDVRFPGERLSHWRASMIENSMIRDYTVIGDKE